MADDEKTVQGLHKESDSCGLMTEEYIRIWSTFQWWCEGALFTGVGLVGLVANILSVCIMSTKDMRKHTFNQLLIALCIWDILFIVVSIPVYAFNLFQIFVGDQVFSLLYVYFLYPMSPVTLCASIYMTLAITIERYLAVCKPIFYRNLTRTVSSAKRVAIYVTPVVIVSICLNIPKFMETQATQTGNSTVQIGATDIRLNPTYMLYYTISQIFHPTLTTGILPMVALIFMNTSIFFGIRKTTFARNQRRPNNAALTATLTNVDTVEASVRVLNNPNSRFSRLHLPFQVQHQLQQQSVRTSENNLAVVLIGITTMHLVCHALRVFLAVYAVYLITDTLACMKDEGGYVPPLWTMCAESVSSLLIMINFSGNFLIYCSILKPFRAYITVFCNRWALNGRCCKRPEMELCQTRQLHLEENQILEGFQLQQQHPEQSRQSPAQIIQNPIENHLANPETSSAEKNIGENIVEENFINQDIRCDECFEDIGTIHSDPDRSLSNCNVNNILTNSTTENIAVHCQSMEKYCTHLVETKNTVDAHDVGGSEQKKHLQDQSEEMCILEPSIQIQDSINIKTSRKLKPAVSSSASSTLSSSRLYSSFEKESISEGSDDFYQHCMVQFNFAQQGLSTNQIHSCTEFETKQATEEKSTQTEELS